MNPDLQALLALQDDDTEIGRLEAQVLGVDARVAELDRERAAVGEALERSRALVADEERRLRELEDKVRDHRQLQEKYAAQLDLVRKPREATAAMAQLDITRRVLGAEEGELQALAVRVRDARRAVELHELELAETDERQRSLRDQVAEQRRAAEAALAAARAKREAAAARVSRSALSKYERIRSRGRARAIVPLVNGSCGNCHTAVPTQRRSAIASGRTLEACEGCGVLLYAPV
jgi:predicted  nucleic acid-binding Zn-ribbon protein